MHRNTFKNVRCSQLLLLFLINPTYTEVSSRSSLVRSRNQRVSLNFMLDRNHVSLFTLSSLTGKKKNVKYSIYNSSNTLQRPVRPLEEEAHCKDSQLCLEK